MKTTAKPSTILVVEDEPLVNWNVADALRDDGFEALQAFSGEQALGFLERRRDIRVVFTDVNLPGMDGIALAAEIQNCWPQIELLMTSGQKQHRFENLDIVTHYGRFVPKPYPVDAVARRIHDILDRAA